jgi:hypothetical protein
MCLVAAIFGSREIDIILHLLMVLLSAGGFAPATQPGFQSSIVNRHSTIGCIAFSISRTARSIPTREALAIML